MTSYEALRAAFLKAMALTFVAGLAVGAAVGTLL